MQNNTIKYIFENKQPELRRLLIKYGLTPARNRNDLWKKTNYLIAKFKDEMLLDVAKIHPDRDLIVWSLQKMQESQRQLPPQVSNINAINENVSNIMHEQVSNACGCSGADGNDYSNANGIDEYSNCYGNRDCNCQCQSNISGEEIKAKVKANMPLLLIGSLLVVGGLLLYNK
jgi:hypothetical protein